MDSLKTIIGSRTLKFEHIKKENSETSNELSILDSALSRVAQKESRIRDAYEAGVDTLEEYKDNKRRLENERQDLLAEINRLKELTAASQDDAPSAEEVLNRVEDVYALLSDPNVPIIINENISSHALYLFRYTKHIIFAIAYPPTIAYKT